MHVMVNENIDLNICLISQKSLTTIIKIILTLSVKNLCNLTHKLKIKHFHRHESDTGH